MGHSQSACKGERDADCNLRDFKPGDRKSAAECSSEGAGRVDSRQRDLNRDHQGNGSRRIAVGQALRARGYVD